MPLIDLKQSAEEARENSVCMPGGSTDRYPYGLNITLNDEVLTKLGFKGPVTVGTSITFTASAKICSTSQHEDIDGEPENSMSLQITAMDIGPRDDDFTGLYPNSNVK